MEDRYFLVGIVTGNPSTCSGKTFPDVYNYVGNEEVLFQIATATAFHYNIGFILDFEMDLLIYWRYFSVKKH